jgi:hypothetical protein
VQPLVSSEEVVQLLATISVLEAQARAQEEIARAQFAAASECMATSTAPCQHAGG